MSGIDPDSGETELEPSVKEANEAEPELQPEQSNRGNEAGEASKPRSKSGADFLIELAGVADLFRTRNDDAYAEIAVNGHRETWSIRSRGFQRWLRRLFYHATGGAPSADAMQSALGVIEAKAHFDGPVREVFVRVGGAGDRMYLDLADEAWRAMEVSPAAGAWSIAWRFASVGSLG